VDGYLIQGGGSGDRWDRGILGWEGDRNMMIVSSEIMEENES